MSKNLDLARSIYADWGRGDCDATEWADPDIEWVRVDSLDPAAGTGLVGTAQVSSTWRSAWADDRADADEYRALDDRRVLVLGRICGRAKTSGAIVETGFANGFKIQADKVPRLLLYKDRDRALADLGLED
jgi:ketosteroid isomerase-like protein